MAYGRMDVSLDRFFERGLLITYRPAVDQSDIPAASGSLRQALRREEHCGTTAEDCARLLVNVKMPELAAFLNSYPQGDPGLEHVFDY